MPTESQSNKPLSTEEFLQWFKETLRQAGEQSEQALSATEIDRAKTEIRRAVTRMFKKSPEIDESVLIDPETARALLCIVCTSDAKAEIAEDIGIGTSTLNRYLRISHPNPRPETLYKISIWLKRNLSFIKARFEERRSFGYPFNKKLAEEFLKNH